MSEGIICIDTVVIKAVVEDLFERALIAANLGFDNDANRLSCQADRIVSKFYEINRPEKKALPGRSGC